MRYVVRQQGFTLLEMLIVIAIIGILASIVLISLGDSRASGRNAQVISQVLEYQKALELYFAEYGRYPSGHASPAPIPSFRRQAYCIGEPFAGGEPCFPFSQAANNTSDFETSLVPDFLPDVVHIRQFIDGTGYELSSPIYRGCSNLVTGVANHQLSGADDECTEADYSIFFALEGANQDCGRAHTVSTDYESNGFTVCQLSSAQ